MPSDPGEGEGEGGAKARARGAAGTAGGGHGAPSWGGQAQAGIEVSSYAQSSPRSATRTKPTRFSTAWEA
ncbi:hypothetical protein GA0115240_15282 [Streptomyces sp. DvalAA-14]|nr:hypothetical protein GA0115240_15282 [Streptomyces sp. DvalAA-14]